ncbi:hypothetical protein ACH5RR_010558 [Cinchona calisaya]|uniref:Protein root UVB sensitive/RUS domain-containing protein n=1 Tax=Cinchona calisaya TaxID=153742 RepID=A0ABD3AJC5_9GENT
MSFTVLPLFEGVVVYILLTKKEPDNPPPVPLPLPILWIETSETESRQYQFEPDGQFSVKIADDSRTVAHIVIESFLNKFFPLAYTYSVNEGYLIYTQFRALQHFSSAALTVLSTQDCDLPCTGNCCEQADVLYDLGTGLEVLSPLCPQLFPEMAGLGNFAKGMAVVAGLLQGQQDCQYILYLPKKRRDFFLSRGARWWTDLILEHNATGEDALWGWLVAAYAADMEKSVDKPTVSILREAYERMDGYYSSAMNVVEVELMVEHVHELNIGHSESFGDLIFTAEIELECMTLLSAPTVALGHYLLH